MHATHSSRPEATTSATQPAHFGDTADSRRFESGVANTLGFATAAAMWTIGYICRLPGFHVPAELVFALLLALMVGIPAFFRFRFRISLSSALAGGAICGLLNLLILGSLLGGSKRDALLPADLARLAAVWSLASVAIGVLAAGIGWCLGCSLSGNRAAISNDHQPATAETGNESDRLNPWPARFACVAIATTLVLLSVGGTVTGFEAGLAVPDWPNSFGYNMFLFPLAKMTGGIYFEHAHRLFGSLVGLTMLTLAIYVTIVERRTSLRVAVWALVVVVITQGVLGGLRVTEIDTLLAVLHGVLAQIFFSGLVILCATLSPSWRSLPTAREHPAAATDRFLMIVAVVALVVQLILGAVYRHMAVGLYLHLGMAAIVILAVGALGVRVWGIHEWSSLLSRLGASVLGLIGLQLMLGFGALAAVMFDQPTQGATTPHTPHPLQVLITTAHQTTGAALLASVALLTAWHLRMVRPSFAIRGSEAAVRGVEMGGAASRSAPSGGRVI